MAAPTITHIICTSALITLIIAMPVFYFYVVDNITVEMIERELKEVTDYVSGSLGNLFLLANSTKSDVVLTKKLNLPSSIRESTYYLEIVYDLEDGIAQYVEAILQDSSGVRAESLILPGPKVDPGNSTVIEVGEKPVVASCVRENSGIYVWLEAGE